jgi:SGNH domain (fused to AT3 domains)
LVKKFAGLLITISVLASWVTVTSSKADSPSWPENVSLPSDSPASKTPYEIKLALIAAMKVNSLAANLTPALKSADARSVIYSDKCMEQRAQTIRYECGYGDPKGRKSIWLIGDSHAAQWFYAVDDFANNNGYRLIVHTKSSCEPQEKSDNKWDFAPCAEFNDWLLHAIAREKPDVLLVGFYSGIVKLIEKSVFRRLATLAAFSSETYVIGDTPKRSKYPPTCLRQNKNDIHFCDTDETKAFVSKIVKDTKAWSNRNGAHYIDVRSWFCVQGKCPATVGSIMLFRDFTHITGVAAKWYSAVFASELVGIRK